MKKARKLDCLGRRRRAAARDAAGDGASRGRDRVQGRCARHPQSRSCPGRLPDDLLRLVSILTPNETEAELLTGIKVDDRASAAKAAGSLLARGVQAVIVTLGSRGAFVATAELNKHIEGFKKQAVDTTAAGDVFNGALAVALAEGQALEQAVRFANAAAAISVTRMGAQPSAPLRKEIEQLAGN